MTDEHDSYDNSDGEDAHDIVEDESTTKLMADVTQPMVDTTKAAVVDDYDEEPIEDYVVKLVVNEQSDLTTPINEVVDAAVTDINGNLIPGQSSSIINAINEYSTTIYDQLNGSTDAITGRRSWWDWWTWKKLLIAGLIALCILGIILAIVFLVLGRKKPSKKSTTSTTTKAVVTKSVSPQPKYQSVPSGV